MLGKPAPDRKAARTRAQSRQAHRLLHRNPDRPPPLNRHLRQ